MDLVFNWQMYVALGLALIILEAFVSTFFLFPLGISLMLTAVAAPFVSLEVELVIFTLLSLASFVISIKFVKPKFAAKKNLTGVDSLVGKTFPVFEEINETQGTGVIKVYADEWRALPINSGDVIGKNEKVKIEKVEGNKVFVTKI